LSYQELRLDHAHVVAVPNGTTITATVTPQLGVDLGMYFVAGPGGGLQRGSDRVSTIDMMVIVDSFEAAEYGTYSLSVLVQ
jgi:hypothetical protein